MFLKRNLIGILDDVIADSTSEENKQKLTIVRDELKTAQTRKDILTAIGKLGPYFLKLLDIIKDTN